MFKDVYKKAVDQIPTEDAYLRVMEKVNSQPQKTKYSYAKVVALAACFLLTVSMISVYENFAPKEPTPSQLPIPTPVAVVSDSTEPPARTPNVQTRDIPQKDVPKTEPTATTVPETVPEAISTSEPTVAPVIEGSDAPVPTPSEPEKNGLLKNAGIPENLGIAVARFTLGDTVTKATYYEYLGKNVDENLVLPEGFTNETPDEHILCLTPGEDFNDRWTFYFSGGENSIFITTTKSTENISSILASEEYEKCDISGISATVFEDGLQKVACLLEGDIGYTVSSYGVSDEDFEKLLISLIK